MIIGRGSKPLRIAYENEEPIYITTPQELKETLYEIIDSVSSINAKIDLDLIKDTHMGVVKI